MLQHHMWMLCLDHCYWLSKVPLPAAMASGGHPDHQPVQQLLPVSWSTVLRPLVGLQQSPGPDSSGQHDPERLRRALQHFQHQPAVVLGSSPGL